MYPNFRNNPRLKGYDYTTNGYYFLTNNTNHSEPYCQGPIKNLVKFEFLDLSNRFTGLSIYYYSIMPTHIHVILALNNCNKSIPEIWRVFKSKTTVMARKNGFQPSRLWQKNYFEHVIRNETALIKIAQYIQNNPYKENLPLNEIYGDRIPDLMVD